MDAIIRSATESEFDQIIQLFNEFASFENSPEKMLNTVDRMRRE